MRYIIRRLVLLTAALMIFAVPVLAEEGSVNKVLEHGQKDMKNQCLLTANYCGNEVDSVQQRIERIKNEIGRGTDVYTNDELRRLNRELEFEIKIMEGLSVGG